MFTVGKRILIEPLAEENSNNQLIGGQEIISYKVVAAGNQVDERIKNGTNIVLNKKNVLSFKLNGKHFLLTNEESILMFYNESEQ